MNGSNAALVEIQTLSGYQTESRSWRSRAKFLFFLSKFSTSRSQFGPNFKFQSRQLQLSTKKNGEIILCIQTMCDKCRIQGSVCSEECGPRLSGSETGQSLDSQWPGACETQTWSMINKITHGFSPLWDANMINDHVCVSPWWKSIRNWSWWEKIMYGFSPLRRKNDHDEQRWCWRMVSWWKVHLRLLWTRLH